MKKALIIFSLSTLPLLHLIAAFGQNRDENLLSRARGAFEAIPNRASLLDTKNVTEAQIDLGKMLYLDPRLSSSWLISCNTCHNLGLAGVDLLETSIGHGWQKGPRNAPTVFNAVFNSAQFWDGRAEDLKEQAKGPVQATVEMNSTPERVVATLKSIPEYVQLFEKAFPDSSDPLSFDNMAAAIEAFEMTLVTPNAPFDKFLEGDLTAMSDLEKTGLQTFLEAGCVACHSGMNVGGSGYFPFGVVEKPGSEILPPNDKGRFEVTRTVSDEYVFKSPSLRNVALTAPYFHSGKVWDLRQAVAIMGTAQLGMPLSENQTEAVAAFLKTLTGEQPQIEYPVLPSHTSETPKPVTD